MAKLNPLPWDQRSNGSYPLPGGYSNFLISLRTICGHVEQRKIPLEDLTAWVREQFELSEISTRVCLQFLCRAGLLHQSSGSISLDERVYEWMQSNIDSIPINLLHNRIKFIGEMLNELRKPTSIEGLRNAAIRYGLNWQTTTQITTRRGWLQSAGLIEGSANSLNLTEAGRNFLDDVAIYVPDSSKVTEAQENPPGHSHIPNSETPEFISMSDLDSLAEKIGEASINSDDPDQFEKLVCEAFLLLGFEAMHLGNSGNCDVLLHAPLGKHESFSVAVETKTSASGKVKDENVNWPTLKDHREKHSAHYSLLIAPKPTGERLFNRATDYSVAVLSAEQLTDLCRRHARAPLNLVDYKILFDTKGAVDLGSIDEKTVQMQGLQQFASLVASSFTESTDLYGRMSSRDVKINLGKDAEGIPEEDIEELLDMFSHPLIGVLQRFGNDDRSESGRKYVLATSRSAAVRKISLLTELLIEQNDSASSQ